MGSSHDGSLTAVSILKSKPHKRRDVKATSRVDLSPAMAQHHFCCIRQRQRPPEAEAEGIGPGMPHTGSF